MSKKIKIAINGFGRIGRAAFKIILKDFPQLEVVAINDLAEADCLAQLLKYDSSYGIYPKKVTSQKEAILVNGKKYPLYRQRDPLNLEWKKLGVDVVLECSGVFRTKEEASRHIKAGAKKVIISAPAKDKVKTIVIGVNDKSLKKTDTIISCASCTTNCLAPTMAVINDKFKIKSALMTTIHSYTADQNLVDSPHKDFRRARAAAINIVPTTTGAAKATSLVIPSLANNFDGISVRVPTAIVSLCDLVCVLHKKTSIEEVNLVLKKASQGKLKNILSYSEDHLVSSDIIANPNSGVIDAKLTNLVNSNLLKLIIWYDNEWAYAQRLVQLAKKSIIMK
jgi:glyceraldehyde 3-phosphate dehydrogenase